MAEITEFVTFNLKCPENHPSASFEAAVSTLKAAPGVTAVYHGTRLEDPAIHLLIIRWSSHGAFADFASSESYTPWLAHLKALAVGLTFYQVGLAPSPAQVLEAPCTEILVAYGIDRPLFSRNLEIFADKVSEGGRAGAIKGWHASAHGEVTTPIAKDADGAPTDAALLLIGWDSKAAHEHAKAKPGPILDNIELIRQARDSVSMFHVKLKKQTPTITEYVTGTKAHIHLLWEWHATPRHVVVRRENALVSVHTEDEEISTAGDGDGKQRKNTKPSRT